MNFVTFRSFSFGILMLLKKFFSHSPLVCCSENFLHTFFFLCVLCDITLMIVPRKDIIIIIIQHTKIDFSYLALQHLSLSLSFLITHICVGILWVAFSLSPTSIYFIIHQPSIHFLHYTLTFEGTTDAQK